MIGEEGVDLFRRRRQAGEIERQPANQRAPVGLLRGSQFFSFEAVVNECVNGLTRPFLVVDGRRHGPGRRDQRPVFFPLGALLDPVRQQVDLLGRQLLAELLRRHPRFVGGRDMADQFALVDLAGYDCFAAAEVGESGFLGVEVQIRLALVLVGTVTGVALVRENRAMQLGTGK